ncbi:uncharacterized protein [Miscanthus floridulus]|uniref:uncharacterized protein n=1 Tax=Miscanthus floridulus TaxID=154761 RepID=UPI00345B3502
MVRIHFPSSNNVVEYEELINGLRIAIELGIRWLDVWGNSQQVIEQVMKESSHHNAKMAAYCREVYQLEDKFNGLELNHISRRLNEVADTLAKAASGRELVPIGIFASNQYKPSIRYEELEQAGDWLPPSDPEVMELDEDPMIEPDPLAVWRAPYLDYLLREALSTDKMKARWLTCRAKSFVLIKGELYRRSHTEILQRYIPNEQGKRLLSDIHGGVYGHHAAPRTLVGNVFRQGFYWLTKVADAEQIMRTCEGCQYYAR